MSAGGSRRRPAALVARLMVIGALAAALIPALASEASAFQPCPAEGVPAADIDSWNTTWPVGGYDDRGVTMCQGMGGTALAYVQIVDLNDGAYLSINGEYADGCCDGVYLADTRFKKKTVADWHGSWVFPGDHTKFSTVNASFYMTEDGSTSPLSLPLYTFGRFARSWGQAMYGEDPAWDAPKKKLVMTTRVTAPPGWPQLEQLQRVRIGEFPTSYTAIDVENAFDYYGPDRVFQGLVSYAPGHLAPGGDEHNTRTMVGTNGDKVYILTTRVTYTLPEARAILKAFGSQEEIQLDGGMSTQLSSQWGAIPATLNRAVPTVITVWTGKEG